MKIAILGAGALGSVIGATLYKSGFDVTLLDKNLAHLAAIRDSGLRVDWDAGTEHLMIPAMQVENAPRMDLVILLTKTLHSQAALHDIKAMIDAGTCVLTLQNGLGNVEKLQSAVPSAQILFGCTMTPGDFVGPGHVASHGMAYTPFDALKHDGPAAALAPALSKGAMEQTPAALSHVWQKAAFNCAMNATAVLGEGTVGDIADFIGQELAESIAAEVLLLGEKEGITTDRAAVTSRIAFALGNHGTHKPSMLQDVEAERPTEIGALNGFVALRGAELAVDVPLNTLLAGLVRMKSRSYLTSP